MYHIESVQKEGRIFVFHGLKRVLEFRCSPRTFSHGFGDGAETLDDLIEIIRTEPAFDDVRDALTKEVIKVLL